MELWKDKNYLEEEFINKRRTAKDIASELKVNDSRIEYYLGRYNLYGVRGRIKNSCNESKFSFKNPVFNYYAGLIATDGYIDNTNNRVSLRLRNDGAETLLNNLNCYFEHSGEIKVYDGSYDLTITSKALIEELLVLNVVGHKKTYDLTFPDVFNNETCNRMFLRGVLDGDGNIKSSSKGHRGGAFRVVTASKPFIQGVTDSINAKFGLDYQVSVAKVKEVGYPKLEMRIADSLNFYEWIYKGYPRFRLSCKYLKYLEVK